MLAAVVVVPENSKVRTTALVVIAVAATLVVRKLPPFATVAGCSTEHFTLAGKPSCHSEQGLVAGSV